MKDQSKTKQVLIQELVSLRERIKELEQSESDRKNMEEALRESEARFRCLLQSVPNVAVQGYEPDGTTQYWNQASERLYGYTAQEAIGRNLVDLIIPPEIRGDVEQAIQQMAETRQPIPASELFLMRKDGSRVAVFSSHAVVQVPGRKTELFCLDVDLTGRKLAEEELMDRAAELTSIYENAPLIMLLVDKEWTIRKTNTFTAQLVGRALGDMINLRCGESLHCIHSLDAPEGCGFGPSCRECTFRLTALSTIETAQSHHDVEARMSLSDAEKKREAIFLLSTARLTVKGQPMALVSMQDITERKKAEEALHRSEENFRRSLDDSPLGVRIVTTEGETIHANRVILDIYGYDSIEELKTTPVVNRYTPESFAEHQIRKEKRKRGNDAPSEYEIRIIGKDAKIRHLQVLRKEILWDGERQFQVIYQDITERKQAEEALRESRDEIQWLFKSMINAFVTFESVFDDNGHFISYRFIYINDAYERITGVKNDEVKGKTVHEVWPETEPEWIKRYGEVAVTGVTQIFDLYHEPTKKFYHCNVYRPWDTKDRFCVIFEDITERKRAEEEKRRMEERSRKVVEDIFRFIPEGVLVFSRKMELLRQNQAFRELVSGYAGHLGFAEDELENLIIDKVKAGLRDNNIKEIKITRKHEHSEKKFNELEELVLELDMARIIFTEEEEEEEEARIVVSMKDITERKRAEEALRESEARYRSLFENNHAVMLLIDPDNAAITDANTAACAYYGWSREELMKRRIDEINTLTSEEVYAEMKLARSEKRNHFFFKHRRADGTIRDVEVYSGPILLKGKTMLYSLVHDITDRKQAEEELRTSGLQLRALATRLQQIREESMIMIAREIHDELGGGLTGLKMDLSWLLGKMSDADPGEARVALMDKIHTSNALIDQMIHVVRRISTDLRPSVLDDLGLIAALEWQAQEFTRRAEIPCEFVTSLDYVNLEDETATGVFRIFQEALTNVGRHSGATKVVAVLRESERSLFGDETLVLEIRDNGRGITEEEILNPESLGLLGMKERVLAFGGDLSICGEPCGGTALILKIPLKQGEPS